MDAPKKPPVNVRSYGDQESALEAWLPRLVESNETLMAALVRLRDFYLAEEPRTDAEDVLIQVRVALERAETVQKGP
jgi:hypothetical protein